MRKLLWIAGLATVAGLTLQPPAAQACGGFFCGQTPVDQQAERILFSVEDGQVTMVTQISYQGAADDFAWVLPLATVPDVESLDTFPQAALSALDANTGPQFMYPEDCWGDMAFDASGTPGGRAESDGDGGVTVHIREDVGPYDVAVVESPDPMELVNWLRDNDFRVTDSMIPYIELYTEEGLKFLALKLQPDSDVNDIAPFKLTMPGQAPSVPLRLTSLAAEPEMGVLVFVLGDMRYGPANVPEIEVDDRDLKWEPSTWPLKTNWTALVARAVDEAGGEGFVTEMAGSTENLISLLESSRITSPEQEEARDALLEIMQGQPYLTRMYTRLSAEEMTFDPIFRRTNGGDVDRTHMLPRYVDGVDMCGGGSGPWSGPMGGDTMPCDFTTCGAGGLCRNVEVDGELQAACACAPGATARTTFEPDGSVTVACQDKRMSFLNPGDRELPGSTPLPDPCVGFDCGEGGSCVAMNMTPTCECDRGYVATGSLTEAGSRDTTCVQTSRPIPDDFYDVRLPDLPEHLAGGRSVDVPETDNPRPAPYSPAGGGGCSVGGAGTQAGSAALLGLALLGLVLRRRNGR